MSPSPRSVLTSFACVLRSACAERGVTREQLACASGISAAVLAAMESGEHAPTLEELVRLAHGLGCEAAQLIERTMAGVPDA